MDERLSRSHDLWNHPEVRYLISRHQGELVAAGVADSYATNLWFSAAIANRWDRYHPRNGGINRTFAIKQVQAVSSDNPLLVARKKDGFDADAIGRPHDTLTLYKLDLDTCEPMPLSTSYWVAHVAPDDSEVIAVQSLFYTPTQAALLMQQSRELAKMGVLANTLTPFELN